MVTQQLFCFQAKVEEKNIDPPCIFAAEQIIDYADLDFTSNHDSWTILMMNVYFHKLVQRKRRHTFNLDPFGEEEKGGGNLQFQKNVIHLVSLRNELIYQNSNAVHNHLYTLKAIFWIPTGPN